MTSPTQHLSDALMTTLDTLFARVESLEQEVFDLKNRPSKRWYTRSEAAAYLGISTTKLWDLRTRGELIGHQIDGKPVFNVDDLDAVAVRDTPVRLVS